VSFILYQWLIYYLFNSPCDFVAKPFIKEDPDNQLMAHYWHKSYAKEEKTKLTNIDEGNG